MLGGLKERNADGGETGRLLITTDGIAEIGRFAAEAVNWANAALLCLEPKR